MTKSFILTNEEIARLRKTYESAKHSVNTIPVDPSELLHYLDEIESRDTQINGLQSELFEVKRASDQRVDGVLKSIDDTLKTLNKFVQR